MKYQINDSDGKMLWMLDTKTESFDYADSYFVFNNFIHFVCESLDRLQKAEKILKWYADGVYFKNIKCDTENATCFEITEKAENYFKDIKNGG